jgi:TolC family type I secretion outer membrane protein
MSSRLPRWLGLLLPLLLHAGGAWAATLDEALVQSYLTNPQLMAARASLRALDESVPRALAGWRPSITASTAQALDQVENSDTGVTLDTRRYGLTLTQPLYSGGETVASTGRAENAVLAGRARLASVEQQVLLETVAAFTAVVREQAVLDLAERNEQRLQTQLDAARNRFRLGEITRTDVAQAETRLARATADRVQAEGALGAAGATYRRVVGQPPDRLATPEPLAGLPGTEQDALGQAEGNPAVAAARFDLATAESEADLALSGLKPRLSLTGEMSYVDEPSTLLDWQRSMTIGTVLSVPLYQGGGEYARVRQSRQTVQQRRQELDDARRRADEQVSAAWDELASARGRIGSLEVQSDRAAFALDGVKKEALVGARTVLDVLDAEQELFAAEIELERGRREEVLAGYRLRAAMGELTVGRLGLDVTPYDPLAHYREVRDKLFGLSQD